MKEQPNAASLFHLREDADGVTGHGAVSTPLPPRSPHPFNLPLGNHGGSRPNPEGPAVCGGVEHSHGTLSETLQRPPGPAGL